MPAIQYVVFIQHTVKSADDYPSSAGGPWSGSGSRGARVHAKCAVVVAHTFERAFAR